MIANSTVVLILFLYHEAFYLLPKEMLIAPGVFRMSDAGLVSISLFALTVSRTYYRYKEESWIVITFIMMMLLSCLMGSIFFPQSFLDGILNIRNNLFWLSFFAFVPLIKNIEQAEKLVKLLTFLIGVYVLILLVTKLIPSLNIIHLPKNVYDKHSSLKRFGDYRLFFPYGNIPLMFFFIALAQSVNGNIKESLAAKAMRLAFMFVVFYACVASMTRAIVFPLLITIAFAFATSKSHSVKIVGIAVIVLLVSFQLLSTAMNSSEESLFENTKLGKLLLKSDKLESEEGRMFQAKMYLTQFGRSPVTGVGNFAIGRFTKYEDGGVMEAIKAYGFYNGSDLGYLKILGENGLIGVAWLLWWFSYFYRRGKQTLDVAGKMGGLPFVEVLIRGILYFTLYLLVSGVTLGHWVHHNVITILPLSLALIAIARVSVNELATSAVKEATPAFSE